MPELTGVIETALYVDDLPRAVEFYRSVLGLETMLADDRLCAMNVAGRDVLLLFKRGASAKPIPIPNGVIPPHDGSGPVHMAFSIAPPAFADWERKLQERGIAIERKVVWPRGGRSLYFRDPDGHLLELATPGIWPNY